MSETLYKGKPVSRIPFEALKVGENVFVPLDAMPRDAARREAKRLGFDIRTVLGPYIGYYTVFLRPPKPVPRRYVRRSPVEKQATDEQMRRRAERRQWYRLHAHELRGYA